MVTWSVLVSVALVGAAEFEATTLDGRSAAGQLVEWNGEQVSLETADGRETFALAGLATLVRQGTAAPAADKAALWVELVDESGLAGIDFGVEGETAHVTLAGGEKLSFPVRVVRWVRFSPPAAQDETLAKQWAEISQTRAGGDLLVVRKTGALDYLEGVQGDIDADVCKFEIDQEVVKVKRTKVEGIVYFHPTEPELPEAVGRVGTSDGSRWTIAQASLGDQGIKISTVAGTTLVLPLDEVVRFDLTAGKIAYLSDLEPERASYAPFFGLGKAVPVLDAFYGYRRDVGFENSPLTLDGKTYRKGLALQSRTVLTYRLPGKFRVFEAVVGIDDSTRATGNAKVQIKADDRTVWEGDVRGTDPPRELELEIGGARRLAIVADYGDDQDVGDRVNLCEARVTK